MDLNELKDRAYKIAKAHGWHDKELSDETYLMLIITEIAEAVQADRDNRHADIEAFKKYEDRIDFKENFERQVKNTVEDELADVVIRSLDLAGLRDIKLSTPMKVRGNILFPFAEYAFNTCHVLTYNNVPLADKIENVIDRILFYCESKGIDLWWYVEQKMRYNELRPYKHGGKAY